MRKRSVAQTSHAAIAKLRNLCDEIEQRLLANEDYQIFIALRKTIQEYESIRKKEDKFAHKREVRFAARGAELVKTTRDAEAVKAGRKAASSAKGARLSQRQATAIVLEEVRQPMVIEALLARLQKMGIKFSSKSPKASLSAQLSSSNGFRIVQYGGKRCWWFSERPIPEGEASR
jgi:hypothetical protein